MRSVRDEGRSVDQSLAGKTPYTTSLALFEGDATHRLLARIGLADKNGPLLARLIVCVTLVGYALPFCIALAIGRVRTGNSHTDFLYDLNCPVQVVVAILFLIAQPLIDHHIKLAGVVMLGSGLLTQSEQYEAAAERLQARRISVVPEVSTAILSLIAVAMWVIPGWQKNQESMIWVSNGAARTHLNALGWWVVLIWGPIFQFIWLRWIWKVGIWTQFLFRVSRTKLRLFTGHADQAGGLAFLGEIQGMFGILIFAIGLVAAVDAISQMVQSNSVAANVYITVGLFVIGAPVVFLGPLLFFTAQMYHAKTEGLAKYEILLSQFIGQFEDKHLEEHTQSSDRLLSIGDYAALSNIVNLHEHVAHMKIVPFDLRTVSKLVASAATPMLPLITHFLPWPPVRDFLRVVFGH